MRSFLNVVAFVLLFVALGCDGTDAPLESENNQTFDPTPTVNASIEWLNLEGGFWAIRGDDGILYDPHPTIEEEFRLNGLHVRFRGTLRPDYVCIHMIGSVVTITEMQRN